MAEDEDVSELEDEVVFSLRMGPLRDQEIKQVLEQFPNLEFRDGSRVVTRHGVTGRMLLRELDDTVDLDQYVQFLRSERCPTENMDLFFSILSGRDTNIVDLPWWLQKFRFEARLPIIFSYTVA